MSIILPNYSARDSAITQRPTSTAIMAIDSEDRFKDYNQARLAGTGTALNATPYDFTIQKGEPILNGAITRIGVNEVVFPWTIPNINQKTKDILVAWNAGAFQTLTLNQGFYTPSDLAAAIQAKVRLLDPTLAAFTMTYGVNTVGATMPVFIYKTNAPGASIAFQPMPADSAAYPFPPSTKQLFDLLGFFDGNSLFTSSSPDGDTTLCQATRYVDIVCSQLTVNQAVKDSMSQPISRDILCRIYVGAASGVQSTVKCSAPEFCPPGCQPTTIYRDFSQAKQIMWMPNCPIGGFLRFQVYDDTGNLLTNSLATLGLGESSNWSMTMLATEN